MTARTLSTVDTPALVVDQTVVMNNLTRMAAKVRDHGMTLVPHTKTHKSPRWASEQLRLGSPRVMVAKLGEAAVLLDHGITDQYIGYPLVGPNKAERLAQLISQGLRPVVAVDSTPAVDMLAHVSQVTAVPIPVLIEVDTGFGRCGLDTPEDISRLARYAVDHGVPYQGITCFGGHISWRQGADRIASLVAAEDRFLAKCADALTTAGLAPAQVSQGGTVIAGYMDEVHTATEMRPGIYIYNDVGTVVAGAASWEDCAAVILASVVSTPTADRAVIDAGSKALSTDGPIHDSFGYLRERPDLMISFLSEEHGVIVRRGGGPTGLTIGDRLTVIPNHVCTAVNLHNTMVIHQDGVIVDSAPIAMRGAVQ